MEHASEMELIELQGGHLPPDRSAQVRSHLSTCADCRRKFEKLTQTWDLLGQWNPAPPRDLTMRVLAAAGQAQRRGAWLGRGTGAARLLQAAAAVLLAIGIGYAAGIWSRPARPGGEHLEHDVVASLYLGTLDSGTPAGLAETLLEGPADPKAEEGR